MPDTNIRTVVLIGTSHKYQYPVHGKHPEGIRSFHTYICKRCDFYGICAIAEEMSLEALESRGFASSGAQKLCSDIGLCHQFSDPPMGERKRLGIFQDADISSEGLRNNWTPEKISAETLERGTNASDQIRENYWVSKIKELDTRPLLFICGADHFNSFAALLHKNGVKVIEDCKDWAP